MCVMTLHNNVVVMCEMALGFGTALREPHYVRLGYNHLKPETLNPETLNSEPPTRSPITAHPTTYRWLP